MLTSSHYRGDENVGLRKVEFILWALHSPTVSLVPYGIVTKFSSHSSGDEPMVILDSHQDWRFRKNVGYFQGLCIF